MANQIDIDNEGLLSDNDILDIVQEKQQQLQEAIEDWQSGLINLLIVRGPPGTGKTETFKEMTVKHGIVSTDIVSTVFEIGEEGKPVPVGEMTTVKGALVRGADYSNWALHADLYANKDHGLLVLDDNDNILKDPAGGALIMKATEQKTKREITFTKAMRIAELVDRGVPPVFETNCGIAILSNVDMKAAIAAAAAAQKKSGKMPSMQVTRFAAMLSRGQYIDLALNTPRAVRVFCEEKIKSCKILTKSNYLNEKFGRSLTKSEEATVLKWVRFNQGKLSEALDLRTYNKVAMLMLSRNSTWEQSSKVRLLRSV